MQRVNSLEKTNEYDHMVKAVLFPVVMCFFFQWDVRVGLWKMLSVKELMLLNCGTGEDSCKSLGLQGD